MMTRSAAEGVPRFALLMSHLGDAATDHKLLATMGAISDNPLLVAPGLVLADLRSTSRYFRTTARVAQSLQDALASFFGLPCDDATAATTAGLPTALLGWHLLRAMMVLDRTHPSGSGSGSGLRVLGPLDIGYRQALRALSWQDWCQGAGSFVALYQHTQSHLDRMQQDLRAFASRLEKLRLRTPQDALAQRDRNRLHTPQDARSILGDDEIQRRFGAMVTTLWHSFCHPMGAWESFLGAPLRRQEAPFNPEAFASESHELPSCPAGMPLDLGRGPAVLIETVQRCLDKLHGKHPFPPMGLKDLCLSFEFGSGHRIDRSLLLNEPIYAMDRTAKAILQQIAEGLLKPTDTAKPDKRLQQAATSVATGITLDGTCVVRTSDGLAIADSTHPERLYFVSHIMGIKVTPVRVASRPADEGDPYLFSDGRHGRTLRDVGLLRRELYIHHGQDSDHYQPVCSSSRPFATHPANSAPSQQPASDLFSHTLRYRPPAVLRRPLPFVWPKPPDAGRLVFMESEGHHDFFLWLYPEYDAALWLCSPSSPCREQEEDDPSRRSYVCLGFFDSLALLPQWVTQHAPA